MLSEKAEHVLLKMESKQLKSIVAVAISAGAPTSDVAAFASAAFLIIGNALEAISSKKANRERDERAQMKEAEWAEHKQQASFECAAKARE